MTKSMMMSSTLMGATSLIFALGILAGPTSWNPGRRNSAGGRRGWVLFPYRNTPGIGRQIPGSGGGFFMVASG